MIHIRKRLIRRAKVKGAPNSTSFEKMWQAYPATGYLLPVGRPWKMPGAEQTDYAALLRFQTEGGCSFLRILYARRAVQRSHAAT